MELSDGCGTSVICAVVHFFFFSFHLGCNHLGCSHLGCNISRLTLDLQQRNTAHHCRMDVHRYQYTTCFDVPGCLFKVHACTKITARFLRMNFELGEPSCKAAKVTFKTPLLNQIIIIVSNIVNFIVKTWYYFYYIMWHSFLYPEGLGTGLF